MKENPKHKCVCNNPRYSGKDTFAADPDNPSKFLICVADGRIYVSDCPEVRAENLTVAQWFQTV